MYAGSSTLDWCQYSGCKMGGIVNGLVDPAPAEPIAGLLLLTAAAVVVGFQWLVGRLK